MKRIIALLLCLIMAVSVVGCNNKNTTNSDGIVTLKWFVPGSSQQGLESVLAEVNKISEEKIGARLEIQFVDDGAFQERMNANMAAGDDYDLAWVGYLNPYRNAAQNGGLYCLDEFLKNDPDFYNSIDEYAWDSSKVDGKIYAVPNMQIHAMSTCLAFLKKYVDKYNFDITQVKKTEDIEPLLAQIAANEKDVYPFRTTYGTSSFRDINETKIYKKIRNFYVVEEDGKPVVKYSWEALNSYDKMQKLHEWYKNGYIRKDVASVTDDEQELRAGRYAVWCGTYKPGVEAEFTARLGQEVVAVPISTPVVEQSTVTQTMIGIGNRSKNPEKAYEMIKLINTDKELYNLLCFGIEGKNYTKTGENRIELIPDSDYNPSASWKFGNQFNAYLLPEQTDTVWEETIEMNKSAVRDCVFGFVEDADLMSIELMQMETVGKKYTVLTNGSEDPAKYFEEFKKEMMAAGAEKARAELQRQVDEFMKTQK